MADVLPTKLDIDVTRHKEMTVKADSVMQLPYLNRFKINHVYQFELIPQCSVFVNCIPLVLKLFNQNVMTYVGWKNLIAIMDLRSYVIGEQSKQSLESLIIGDYASYSWRNVFSCINLLRSLNKSTKWKPSQIMTPVVFKFSPILQFTLKVHHALIQLYMLKLLTMQIKYLGHQWSKSKMKIISANYAKVQHQLDDEEILTLLTEAKGIVNVRPLTYLPVDMEESEALIRDHLLLCSSSGVRQSATECTGSLEALKCSWSWIQNQVDCFWKRWMRDMLPDLTERTKWHGEVKPIAEGDLAMIVEGARRNGWIGGRVQQIVKGVDGRIRQVLVQTAGGILRRPVSRLAILGVDTSGKTATSGQCYGGEDVAATGDTVNFAN